MRPIWILTAGLVFFSAATALGQTRQSMDDPLFAIRYDTQKIVFESVPNSLVRDCPELRGRYKGAWIYGHTKTPDADYFIISGLMDFFDEETGKKRGVYPDETGLIVAVEASTCRMEAQDGLYWLKDSPVWNLTETTFNQLVNDIFRRYTKAFGGKKNFLKNIPSNRQYLGPVLQGHLEKFEKQH